MSEPKCLLVIDDKNSPYETFFASTGWIKIEPPNLPFTPNLVSSLIKEAYDAILVDYDWLKKQDEYLLVEFQQTRQPFIIVARGNPSDGCKWAMGKGASGYIPEEKFEPKLTRDEIDSILKYYQPRDSKQVRLGTSHFEQLVDYFLQQPDICFRHWTNFFGKTAIEAFEPEALALLGNVRAQKIGKHIRAALIQAQEDGEKKIKTEHLRTRFRSTSNPVRQAEVDSIGAARVFFEEIDKSLATGKSLTQIAELRRVSENEIKATLKKHRKKHPSIDIKGYLYIYHKFPLRLAAFWANKREVIAHEFLNTYLDALGNDFAINGPSHINALFSDKAQGAWDHQYTDDVDVFVYFLCRDSIRPSTPGTEVIAKALARQRAGNERPVIIGLRIEVCNHHYVLRDGNFIVLPEDEVPLEAAIDINVTYTYLAEKIRSELFNIWPT